jgi:hypothetical protein
MYRRAVRFTDVSADRIDELITRINAAGGPPPGVRSTGIKLLFDASRGTALVIQEFATAEDMKDAAAVFEAMDASETPGTRASVDECELKLDLQP